MLTRERAEQFQQPFCGRLSRDLRVLNFPATSISTTLLSASRLVAEMACGPLTAVAERTIAFSKRALQPDFIKESVEQSPEYGCR
jgi:hypothetical protein